MSYIIVPDDHNHKKYNFTFLVYDSSGKLIHSVPYNEELDCKELKGQGRPTFRPFGVTTDDDYIYVASNNRLGKYNKETFEYCGLVDIPMYINTHQIMKSGDSFYVCHTSVNTIGCHGESNTYFDLTTLSCIDAPKAPENAKMRDVIHVNSITEHEGKIYFCLHNLGLIPSQFGYFDKQTYESKIISSAGLCCHDVKILNDKLYALSSHTGEIIEVDLNTSVTETYKIVDSKRTFLRGMDISDNRLIFVGSNFYMNNIPMNNCFVASFDTDTKMSSRIFNINDADVINHIKII